MHLRHLALLAFMAVAHLATMVMAQTPNKDDYLVKNLPDLPPQDAEQLMQYAGHINLEATLESQLFFWLVTNKTIPKKSKLIIWLNGGPGCSSADGYFLEGGPLRFINGTLTINKGGWHEFANVLFLDQPVGTGFSITSNQMLGSLPEISDHFVSFMKAFFAIFPDRIQDDVYIAGESYAGTYIPYFAKAALERNDKLKPGEQPINLQGIAIGNGWTDPLHQYTSYVPFLQKSQVSTPEMLEELDNQMNVCLDAIRLQDRISQDPCERLVEIILQKSMNGDPLNPKCMNQYDIRLQEDYPACGSTWPYELPLMKQYLDRPDVKAAFHATAHRGEWRECNGLVQSALRADDSIPAVAHLPYILSKTKVLLYSGEQDLICNHIGTEYMISNLTWEGARGFQEAPVVDWTVEGKAAGQWQVERNLSYVLIHNSSHMVPYDVPLVTLDMMNRFMGIDHKLQWFSSSLSTDKDDQMPPAGEKQNIGQPEASSYSVNGAAILILTMIAVGVALFVIRRNNRQQRKRGGDAQWFPLGHSLGGREAMHTDELGELVMESDILESDEDEDEDDEQAFGRRDTGRDSLNDSQGDEDEDDEYRSKAYDRV